MGGIRMWGESVWCLQNRFYGLYCDVTGKTNASQWCPLAHKNSSLSCCWFAAEVKKFVFWGSWCYFQPFFLCIPYLTLCSDSIDRKYIVKYGLYTPYVSKIRFVCTHGGLLLTLDFLKWPWGEFVGVEFVWVNLRKIFWIAFESYQTTMNWFYTWTVNLQ